MESKKKVLFKYLKTSCGQQRTIMSETKILLEVIGKQMCKCG